MLNVMDARAEAGHRSPTTANVRIPTATRLALQNRPFLACGDLDITFLFPLRERT
jgi:hypothetical protein